MSDPTLPFSGWDVAGALWKIILTILGWIGIQQKRRIDDLEKALASKASTADTEKESDRLEAAFKDHRQETREAFLQVTTRLDNILERMAARDGRL